MPRPLSKLAPEWWDYTTLDAEILDDAAHINEKKLRGLTRPGFTIHFYETVEEFFTAEALEYIEAWKQSTPDNPVGVCGPVGPTEQLPLVARIVNAIGLNLKKLGAYYWGMDEWILDGKPVTREHPLSFDRCVNAMCFSRIEKSLRPHVEQISFPTRDLKAFSDSFNNIRCALMQGGQGEIKHWAFNDPVKRAEKYRHAPPSPEEYRKLGTREVTLHPVTITQNARTSGGGNVALVPTRATTVGPRETWKADKVSIWHPGWHDNPFGIRLTALMISKGLADSSVPMSLLADHPNVHFHYLRPNLGSVVTEMH